jgi:putative flippase GtrA
MTPPVLDVVVPVHNEQHTLRACVTRLHDHLVQTFPYPFRISVADNASTDATWQVACGLAAEYPVVAPVRLEQKGRGRALKAVWLGSDAPILAYLDVDLSTDLDALWPLVAPLMSGHSDLAIGTRLHRGSRVVRGPRREVISRCYDLVLRAGLGARFSDAQCGFKAIRGDVAAELLPLVEDTSWFFDTELLVLAERSRLRTHEVPVDDIAVRTGRGDTGARLGGQLVRFAGVGVVSTVVHLGLFALLRLGVESAQVANLVALGVAATANTALNRRWTFGVRGRERAARQQAQALTVFALTLLMTSGALGLLGLGAPGAPTWLQTGVLAVATAVSTVVRFVAMRRWIFRPAGARPPWTDPTQAGSEAAEPVEVSG